MKTIQIKWEQGRYNSYYGETPFWSVSTIYDGVYGNGYIAGAFNKRKDGFATHSAAQEWVQKLFEHLLSKCYEEKE